MAGQRQPIALVQAKGKKHLTKAEIEERQRTGINRIRLEFKGWKRSGTG